MKKLYKHKKNGVHLFFSYLSYISYSDMKSSYARIELQIDYSLKYIKGKSKNHMKYTAIFPFILHNYSKSEIN